MNTVDKGSKAAHPSGFLLLLVGVSGGLLFWFGMLYPLFPKTLAGWFFGIGAGVFVGLWTVVSAFAIDWLRRQQRFWLLCRAAATLIALSLGVGIFWIALNGQDFVTANFSYFGR